MGPLDTAGVEPIKELKELPTLYEVTAAGKIRGTYHYGGGDHQGARCIHYVVAAPQACMIIHLDSPTFWHNIRSTALIQVATNSLTV